MVGLLNLNLIMWKLKEIRLFCFLLLPSASFPAKLLNCVGNAGKLRRKRCVGNAASETLRRKRCKAASETLRRKRCVRNAASETLRRKRCEAPRKGINNPASAYFFPPTEGRQRLFLPYLRRRKG